MTSPRRHGQRAAAVIAASLISGLALPPLAMASPEGDDLVKQVNQQRAAAGCPTLILDTALGRIADDHAKDMATTVTTTTTWSDGSTTFQKAKDAGYGTVTEAVGWGFQNAGAVTTSWMSGSLRNELLDCRYTAAGGGHALTSAQSPTWAIVLGVGQASPGQTQASPGQAQGNPAPTAGDVASADAATLEQQVLDLVNRERKTANCPDLTMDSRLRAAARKHSADVVAHPGIVHTGSDGSDPLARMVAAGYPGNVYWGENVAQGQPDATAVMDSWMNEQPDATGHRGHRENILNCNFKSIGIGVVRDGNGRVHWTQDFGSG